MPNFKSQISNAKAQRVTMLVALVLLILVIAKSVAAGTAFARPQKSNVAETEENTPGTAIKKVVSEIEDMPWRPLLSLVQ